MSIALRFRDEQGQEFPQWQAKKLKDISQLITKGTTPKKFSDKGVNFIKIECFEGNKINLKKSSFIDEITHKNELKRSILFEGDILFAIAGATVGKCNFVNNEILPANTNQALAIIRLKKNENRVFIYQMLISSKMVRYIDDNKSVGAQPNLNLEQMGNFLFAYPSSVEQTKIANFLTAVDEKITQLTQKCQLLAQYKKGVMQQIFSQALRFKDDVGQDFPEWETKQLCEISQINPKAKSLPDEFIYIDLESVVKGSLLKENWVNSDEAPSRAQRFLSRGDVLFQTVRPYQSNNLFFNKIGYYVASTGYAQLRASGDPKFLYYCLHLDEFIGEVMNRCIGTSYPAINSTELASIGISVPVQKEQTKIANFLTAIDDKLTHTQAQLTAAKHYKQGLLQQLFVWDNPLCHRNLNTR